MKHGIKFAAGVAVLLSAAFLLLPFGQKAQALGGKVPQAIAERREKAKSQVKQIRENMGGLLCASAKTAKSSSYIGADLTVSSPKTYSSNVTVNSGVSLTVAGGSLTVNGDLTVYGSLTVTGGTLTVNGDLFDFGTVSASGHGLIKVNKAASGGKTGYAGGNIIVGTDDLSEEGSFFITDSASVTVNKVTSDTGFWIWNGYFGMNSAAAACTVNGTFFAGGSTYDETGASPLLGQGTLTVNGDFYADSTNSDYPFAPAKDFNVVIGGPASVPRQVLFDDPDLSYFTSFSCGGVTFTGSSVFSLHLDLGQSKTADFDDAMVSLEGKTNGKALAVSAQSLIVNTGDDFDVSGNLTVGGDLDIEGTMEFSGGKLSLDGNLCDNGRLDLSAGELSLNGSLYQYGQYDSQFDTCIFRASGNFSTKIMGTNRTVHFDDPVHSFIRNLEMGKDDSLTLNSILPLQDLDSDLTVPGAVNFSGSLNGHTLTVQGAAVIPAGSTASVDGGTLFACGDLTVSGALVMSGYNDQVIVGGNFTANSADTGLVSTLTGGRLSLQGNFTQSGAANSFAASGSHTTILCKTNGRQTVTFHSAPSKFAYLAVINDKMTSSDFSDTTRYSDIVFSGTGLTGIGVSAGTLSPQFSSNAGTYHIYLPQGKNATTVTLSAKYPSGVVVDYSIDGGEKQTASGGITVDGVPSDGKKTLTVTVNAVNSVYAGTNGSPLSLQSSSYYITIETIDPDLKSLSLPAGAAADKAFDPDALEYTVDLPETVASFNWAPVIDNPDSSLAIENDTASLSYGASTTVSLALGGNKAYLINTTTQDGKQGNLYNVTFVRKAPVSSITVSPGTLTPAFSPATANYSLTIPSTVSTVTVKAARGADCSALTFDGAPQAGDAKAIQVNPGCTVTTVVAGTDGEGRSVTAYSVRITRAIMITGVSVSSPGFLDTPFNPAVQSYNVNIGATVSSVKITPAKFKTGVKAIYINGKKATNITVKPRIGETLPVRIQALASDGKTWSPVYTVTITRAPLVTDIHVTAGSLAFSPTTLTYTVFIPAETASVTASAVKTLSGVSSVTGDQTLSPPLNGSATAWFTAVAADGKTKVTYTVTAKRSVITGIGVTGGTLSLAFDPAATFDRRTYIVSVPATASSVTLTPHTSTDCTSLKINGVEQSSITVPLAFGETKSVTIEASTALGTTAKYQVNATRAALVTNITSSIKAYPVNPAFNPANPTYAINLPVYAGSVTIKAAKASRGVKSLTINGKKASSLTVKLPPGGSIAVVIVATATDGTTQGVYTVTVSRAVS